MKLLLTGGGTAGHIMPCLALIDYVNDFFDEIAYAGDENGMEKTLVEQYPQVKFYHVPSVKLIRSFTPKNLALPFKLVCAVRAAKKLLAEIKPDVIFSKGGYVSLPITLAAKVPLVVHESDYTVGLANKAVLKKCAKFCCGFEDTAKKYGGIYTGIPLRKKIYCGVKQNFFRGSSKPVLLITGGSLGAKALNEAVLSQIDEIKKSFDIIHLVGKTGEEKRENGYIAQRFAFDMENMYASCDYVLSRGGATALCEIISLKKPALIVPLPKGNSRGDQVVNAKYYAERGLIRVLPECSLNELSAQLAFLKDDGELKLRLASAQSVDGAKKTAEILKSLASEKRL